MKSVEANTPHTTFTEADQRRSCSRTAIEGLKATNHLSTRTGRTMTVCDLHTEMP